MKATQEVSVAPTASSKPVSMSDEARLAATLQHERHLAIALERTRARASHLRCKIVGKVSTPAPATELAVPSKTTLAAQHPGMAQAWVEDDVWSGTEDGSQEMVSPRGDWHAPVTWAVQQRPPACRVHAPRVHVDGAPPELCLRCFDCPCACPKWY